MARTGGGPIPLLSIGFFLVLALIACCAIAETEITDSGAMAYLSQYGYLPPPNPALGSIVTKRTLHDAIAEFQQFAGLNATGQLDRMTAHMMSLPRCGVKDKIGISSDGRSKRYALQGSRWKVKKLTYNISKYPRNLPKANVDKEIAKAFSVWSDYTDLTFTPKKSGPVHIEIRFERGEHGDGDPFDGPGGTLAHAYFPVYGGDAHFDDAESWSIDSYRGTNLFQVAAHEFGHSLGLSHSEISEALMAPFYRGYDPNFILNSDDIRAIQILYGTKTEVGGAGDGSALNPRTSTPAPTGEEDPELCNHPKVDTMFSSVSGDIYAFKGDRYWKLTADGVESGYPRLINSTWKGLPGNIDAAFTYANGKTYFFKGSQYWRFVGKKMDDKYPKEISVGFTGIPDNIDATVVWTGNGKIYFFKGTKFWGFDPALRPPVRNTYPKSISNWGGIPDNLDTAVTYKGYTYFFKDKAYYRFSDRNFAVDKATPAFPRSTAYWWFGCKSANRGTIDVDDSKETVGNELPGFENENDDIGSNRGYPVLHPTKHDNDDDDDDSIFNVFRRFFVRMRL